MKTFAGSLLVLALAALALYAAVLALLWWKQEALLFQPRPLPADHRLATGPDGSATPRSTARPTTTS